MSSRQAREMYSPGDGAFHGDHFQPADMSSPRRTTREDGCLWSSWWRSEAPINAVLPARNTAQAMLGPLGPRPASRGQRPPPDLSRSVHQRLGARHVVSASSRGPCSNPGPRLWPVRHLGLELLGLRQCLRENPDHLRVGSAGAVGVQLRTHRAQCLAVATTGRSGPPLPPRRSPVGTPGEPERTSDAAPQPSRA